MTNEKPDNPDLDPEFTPTEAVEQDHRGTMMVEFESYERIVEGLKKSADGARHMARWRSPDLWNALAGFLDQLRRAVVREAGYNRLSDAKDSLQQFGGEGLSWSEANSRLLTGLRDAEAGSSQIAMAQRMDLRWARYANQFRAMRDKAHGMALDSSPLKVAAQWGGARSGRMQ